MNIDIQELIQVVRRAGALIRDVRPDPEDIESKEGHRNFVTRYDELVQAELKRELAARWPDLRFIGEEEEEHLNADKHKCFIVDPIDGTSNFIHGVPFFAISVAAVDHGDVRAGVVYNPAIDELFYAEAGKGAFCNGEPITCTSLPLCDALFTVGLSPYRSELMAPSLRLMERLQPQVTDLRRLGAAALDLCYVAKGIQAGFCEFSLCPWDVAAGSLIAREAGAIVSDPFGAPLPLNRKTGILACAPQVYETVLDLVKEVGIRP